MKCSEVRPGLAGRSCSCNRQMVDAAGAVGLGDSGLPIWPAGRQEEKRFGKKVLVVIYNLLAPIIHAITGQGVNEDESLTIGDKVETGVCAQILGPVRIGNNCRIGALTLVIEHMPVCRARGENCAKGKSA